jgi:molecular chaperone DnaJ
LAKKHHPDAGGDKKKFQEIQLAYDTLSDPRKKSQYDSMRSGGFGGFGGGNSGGFGFDDFFSFKQGFGHSWKERQYERRGVDIVEELELTMEEMYYGCNKSFTYKKEVTCSACHGTGARDGEALENCRNCNGTGTAREVKHTSVGNLTFETVCSHCHGRGKKVLDKCPVCNGTTKIHTESTISVEIKPGSYSGMKIIRRRAGSGKAGYEGDLIITLKQKVGGDFDRDFKNPENVRTTEKVSFLDALLGCELVIKTLDGKVAIKMPPGTQHGKVYRLGGKGFPLPNIPHRRGDFFVEIEIDIPKELTDEQRKALEDLRDSGVFDEKDIEVEEINEDEV